MMAHHSRPTPERRPLSDATLAVLREAVVSLWRAPSQDETRLAAALQRMVAEARERALRAEEVIYAFKELLADLPELDGNERRLEAAHFRERLITRCIKAYYQP